MKALIFVWLLLIEGCGSMKWLAAEFPDSHDWTKKDCMAMQNKGVFSSSQRRFCLNHADKMGAVHRGARQTKQICKEAFNGKRWNCSSIDLAPKFSVDLRQDTKEAAFVEALSSASIAYQFAHDCFANENCSCSKQGKVWYGDTSSPDFHKCMDSMDKGLEFSNAFLAVVESEKKRKKLGLQYLRSNLLRRHNQAVGREVLRGKEEVKCKCLSPSQSCATQICYKLPPFFKDVTEELTRRYDNARQVTLNPSGTQLVTKPGVMYDATKNDVRSPLYYHDESPNFCDSDEKSGLLGTKGRTCTLKDGEANSCKTLCCGRGYTLRSVEETKKCNCKFVYCCRIECEECREHKLEYACK